MSCPLRTDPAATLARPMHENFDLIETLFEESHHWRYLLACRCCGQRYLFEFFEEIDWEDGDDPSWVTYLPIAKDVGLAAGRRDRAPLSLRAMGPHLRKDHPKGGPAVLRWSDAGAAP